MEPGLPGAATGGVPAAPGRAGRRAREPRRKGEQRRRAEEATAHTRWRLYHRSMRVDETDEMSGVEFERFIKTLLERHDYQKVEETPLNGDQGCDLVAYTPDGKKTVVQTKRWKGPVGNSAIQEILGAMLFYDAEIGLVVTNNRFTEAAKKLAAKGEHINLVDRKKLGTMIRKKFPREVPEFNWNDYNKYVKGWQRIVNGKEN